MPLDSRAERGAEPDLRPTAGYEIEASLLRKWPNVSMDILPFGQKGVVADGWHGAGFIYDARVDFGDVLTAPLAGTELSAPNFTKWLESKGFLFEQGAHWLNAQEAATLLASREQSVNGEPIFRAWRRAGSKTPIQIEFFNGSRSAVMQRLTYLGNKGPLSDEEKAAYSKNVANLTFPFISKGTTKVGEHLGLPQGYRRNACKDDCLALDTTFAAYKMISLHRDMIEKRQEPLFWADDVAIATTQGIAVAIFVAEKYNVPQLIRAGGPSFGIGGTKEDLGYMRNTQPEMTRYGKYTSGDFGDNMLRTAQSDWNPALIHYGHGSPLRETTFFLRGGGPIMDLMFRSLEERNKRHQGIISLVQAKRIDHGPKYWSVAVNGIHAQHEDAYNPRYYIEKGAILLYGKQTDSNFRLFEQGQLCREVSQNQDGFRVLEVEIGGRLQILYEPLAGAH